MMIEVSDPRHYRSVGFEMAAIMNRVVCRKRIAARVMADPVVGEVIELFESGLRALEGKERSSSLDVIHGQIISKLLPREMSLPFESEDEYLVRIRRYVQFLRKSSETRPLEQAEFRAAQELQQFCRRLLDNFTFPK